MRQLRARLRLRLFDAWRDTRTLFWRVVPHRRRLLWEDDNWCTFCERDHGERTSNAES
jgi:hypothetical protein